MPKTKSPKITKHMLQQWYDIIAEELGYHDYEMVEFEVSRNELLDFITLVEYINDSKLSELMVALNELKDPKEYDDPYVIMYVWEAEMILDVLRTMVD